MIGMIIMFSDYTEAQFIHRETVEDMNSEIKQFGTAKIEAMIESADFRKVAQQTRNKNRDQKYSGHSFFGMGKKKA